MTTRRLGLIGSTAIGLASMLGAGLFVVFPEAARAAGSAVMAALAIAGAVALCNAWSSARLAARMPRSGGAYVYGRERLGVPWGVLAGGAFIVGKTASCATMALAIGWYAWPDHHRWAAVVALVVVAAVNVTGIERSAAVAVAIAAVVIGTVAVALLSSQSRDVAELPAGDVGGTLRAAALLFFAFAGYARLATLGGEVKRPAVTIPRAITLAVVIVGAVYAVSLWVMTTRLGADLATTAAPFVGLLDPASPLRGVVRVVTAVSVGGALLALTVGISRTASVMAEDGVLPRAVRATNRHGAPWSAELVVAVAAALLVTRLDVGDAVAVSSVCVLLYYSVANAAAWTLGGAVGRTIAVLGLAGCVTLASALLIT
ncbi:MAG TPA: APC family permease [Aeromicrobium sp.]|nr:APC family permease [Aeromicrobium sp.]